MNTAQDIAAYLLATTGGGAQDGEHAAVRQAIINGVREVMQARNWNWHTRPGSFTTGSIATTCSITQGSKSIVVASADGFYPGRAVSVSAPYFPTPTRVASVSGTTVTLDVAASQTASNVPVKVATYYDLPLDLKDIDTLVTNTVGTLHCYITPQEWQRLEVNTRGAGEPYYYTIMRSDINPDRWQVRFVGVPVNSTVVNYTYRVTPQPIKYIGYERICRQGTVQVSMSAANVPLVAGTGTAFPQDCSGCYMRFGAAGMEADAQGSSTPFVVERRIEQWFSATSMRLSSHTISYKQDQYAGSPILPDPYDGGAIPASVSSLPADPFDSGIVPGDLDLTVIDAGGLGVASTQLPYSDPFVSLPSNTKYAITDVIDASPHMWTAILSSVEMWYARIAGKPAGDVLAMFNRDIRIAMENDQIAPLSGRPHSTPYPTPRSMGWHSELMPDVS